MFTTEVGFFSRITQSDKYIKHDKLYEYSLLKRAIRSQYILDYYKFNNFWAVMK